MSSSLSSILFPSFFPPPTPLFILDIHSCLLLISHCNYLVHIFILITIRECLWKLSHPISGSVAPRLSTFFTSSFLSSCAIFNQSCNDISPLILPNPTVMTCPYSMTHLLQHIPVDCPKTNQHEEYFHQF